MSSNYELIVQDRVDFTIKRYFRIMAILGVNGKDKLNTLQKLIRNQPLCIKDIVSEHELLRLLEFKACTGWSYEKLVKYEFDNAIQTIYGFGAFAKKEIK